MPYVPPLPPRTREIHLYNGRGGRKGERERERAIVIIHLRTACAKPAHYL